MFGKWKDKLIASKTKRAEEKRGTAGLPVLREDSDPPARLPPGQHLTDKFPVLDLGDQPEIDQQDWGLVVDGAVETPLTWTWSQFQKQPQVSYLSDIHCVTSWSRYDNRWQGVSALHLADLVQPKAEANYVLFKSYDGYTTNVVIDQFLDSDVLIAHSWQGKPLSREHGGPVRIVIPKLYFWKSAKWIKRITFAPLDDPGFWETRGYHNNGDPWGEERYS